MTPTARNSTSSRKTAPGYTPYEPLGALKPVAEDIWTVDGPEIAYSLGGLTIPCPTRMTVVRLAGGQLWLHSPTAFSAALADHISALGKIAFLVAPNTFHYEYAADWRVAFPDAALYAPPRLPAKALKRIGAYEVLTNPAPDGWSAGLSQIVIDGDGFVEVVFFHHASRSLIVTDLMQNFEPGRVRNPIVRALLRIGGATGPNGRASIEMRIAARNRRAEIAAAAERMIAWKPARILLAHGQYYEGNAEVEIRHAFNWATG